MVIIILKFKRVLKRKVYPTWVSQRVKGYKVYIFQVPRFEPYYHFQIVSDEDLHYSSLAEGFKYETFDEVCLEAENWIKQKL